MRESKRERETDRHIHKERERERLCVYGGQKHLKKTVKIEYKS
mgnify:CR=1 FL=1